MVVPTSVPSPMPVEVPTMAHDAIQRSDPTGGMLTIPEVYFTGGILIFAMAALCFLYLIARLPTASPFLLRIYIVTIIVFGTLAVVSSAVASKDIAPVVGLFGTIAGYIMGRSESAGPSKAADPG